MRINRIRKILFKRKTLCLVWESTKLVGCCWSFCCLTPVRQAAMRADLGDRKPWLCQTLLRCLPLTHEGRSLSEATGPYNKHLLTYSSIPSIDIYQVPTICKVGSPLLAQERPDVQRKKRAEESTLKSRLPCATNIYCN